jgi:peptide/nickel transport system ATP-binding protein
MTEPLLRISELRIGVRRSNSVRPLVEGVDLAIEPGQRAALVGESGSGKTLTALSVMRLNPPPTEVTGGRIELAGQDIVTATERDMVGLRGAEMAMIYQDPLSSLNPVRTVGHQLVEAIRAHTTIRARAAKRRAVDLLGEVGVPDPARRVDDYPHQFSGGMRQRVMIAMAISCSPSLLIADEPTTALDVTTQARILDLLVGLSDQRGMAVLFITHDLAIASGFCERINVMRHGKLVEHGEMGTVLAAPAHPYTRTLLDAVVTLEAEPRTEAGEPSDVDTPLVEARDVVRTFGASVRAVDGVSLSIPRGGTFGLVGESGSGKSTLAGLLLGLDRPDSGSVRFAGTDLATLSREALRAQRRHMQVVLQDPIGSLNRRKTVAQIVDLPLAVHGRMGRAQRRERVAELLDLVQLPKALLGRYPRELSGGQCQRVNIARAIALKPDFLVLDEAVSAVDVVIQAQILDLLGDLQDELGLTYLFVSHDLAVVRYMAPTIAVMYRGRIVEQGDRADIFRNPAHEYTRQLIDAIPDVELDSERVRG